MDNTIHFEDGILGFEDTKDYVLLAEDDRNFLFSFQAAKEAVPSLVVINPYAFMPDYTPILPAKDVTFFGSDDATELTYLVVAAIRENGDCVVNLKAPLVIHPDTRQGRQVILENTDYPVRHVLYART